MPADSVPSNGNGSMDGNASDSILGSSPGGASLRVRTESESSDNAPRFVLPSLDGSPPKIITLNELEGIVGNIQKMEMVHEIVLNPEYELKPYEPPEKSLEQRIKETLHQVFWDLLRQDLQLTPPKYDYAIKLLTEIKECFHEILFNNQRAFDRINEYLDEALIRQQAEKGVLDFKGYADFVIGLMAKSCAPARDEAVKKLTEIDDVVDTFKGILEVMTLMKMDIANYLIQSARNNIIAHSVEFEKEKFKEYLEYYKFGFPATENWLKRNCNVNGKTLTVDQTIFNAYMEFMDWDEANEFPELFSMDKQRILKLGLRAKRLCVCASINAIASGIPVISQRNENRISLAKDIAILLQDCASESEINSAIVNIWEQFKAKVNDFLEKEGEPVMDEATENTLKAQILPIANKDSPVRLLMWKRLRSYYNLVSRSKNALPPRPPGFEEYKDELESYTTALKLVTSYNHSVFGEHLRKILTGQQMPRANDSAPSTSGSTENAAPVTVSEINTAPMKQGESEPQKSE